MKRIYFILTFLWICTVLEAQKIDVHVQRQYHTDSTEVRIHYKTRYVAPIWSNFYLTGDFSGRMLCSEEDTHLSLGKRIKPGFTFGIGKQLHPDYAVQLSFGGLRLDGWNNSNTPGVFKQYSNWEQNVDPMKAYYESIGKDVSKGYVHQLRYFEVNADLIMNLHNLFTRYNYLTPRRWQWEAYLGVSYLYVQRWRGTSRNAKVGARMGLQCTYHPIRRLGIQAKIGGTLSSATFDCVIGKGALYDGILQAGIGLKWYIGKQGFKVNRMVPKDELPTHVLTKTYEEQVRRVNLKNMVVTRDTKNSLLIPSIVFAPKSLSFDYELQNENIYEIALLMKRYPEICLMVVGNTNKDCSHSLALRRARRIRQVLITDYGIDPERLQIDAYDVNAKYDVDAYDDSVNFTLSKNYTSNE